MTTATLTLPAGTIVPLVGVQVVELTGGRLQVEGWTAPDNGDFFCYTDEIVRVEVGRSVIEGLLASPAYAKGYGGSRMFVKVQFEMRDEWRRILDRPDEQGDDVLTRPLLLIDVDGPLNPFMANPTKRPAGYDTYRMRPAGWTTAESRKPLRVWLNPAHGPMLLALADIFELTWCTSWRDDANEWIAPNIGLPKLPVVPVEHRLPRIGAHWKIPDVEDYAQGRPLAWMDDDFVGRDFDWAQMRTDAGAPTLLVDVSPRIGLRAEDLDQVQEWAGALAEATRSA